MAIDPEEFKRKREEKEQQRQKKQRSAVVRLVIAGIVLALCGLLIFLVTGNPSAPDTPVETTGAQIADPTGTEAATETVIRLAAVGDLNVTEAVVASGGMNYDYTNAFLDVAPLLADADITTVNFEGNLYGTPYGTDRSAPQNLMTALQQIGVDMVQLANSYSIYKGMHGLEQTIDGIRLAGMEPLGVYANAREAAQKKGYTLCTVQGVKIAFVAFTKGMDGMALPAGNEGCVNLLYKDYSTDYQKVDTEGITKILDAVEKEKPDLVVALLHWGSEFNNTISQTQKDICKLLQQKGVDAIIGGHSHYVQSMVYDETNGSFIAYSLGDFFGNADKAGSEYSVILELEITKQLSSGETKITGYSYTPIFTVAEEGKPLKVVRIAHAMTAFEEEFIDKISQETYDAMNYALQRIEARVNEEVK
jgi:poly-gamma-glutamate synthesis protein (capsule biosynthesis protein)